MPEFVPLVPSHLQDAAPDTITPPHTAWCTSWEGSLSHCTSPVAKLPQMGPTGSWRSAAAISDCN